MHTLYNAPRHPSGGIAKWPKATVCKTVIRGFKSHSRLRKSAPFTGALFASAEWDLAPQDGRDSDRLRGRGLPVASPAH